MTPDRPIRRQVSMSCTATGQVRDPRVDLRLNWADTVRTDRLDESRGEPSRAVPMAASGGILGVWNRLA
ncbi:MAG: hypothetical protein H6678_10140 [Candidatus Delongbacteria bacterium]|nr:hypothetical protein [Candidatus Delongbacteria bacterium]